MFEFSINSSTCDCFKEVYSYSQYHWCPFTLIVTDGVLVSSIRYKVFSEGRAMNSKRIPGMIVQIDSISCPSIKYLLNTFLRVKEMSK